MGKGTIISGGTDGQYQVSVIYNTDRASAEKAANLAKIANLEAQIAAETDEQKLNILKLQKLSLEKRNETLDAIPESKDVTAWCADLTEDLTGDVGLVEVPGESVAFNIQPGYNDNAAYDATRDGQLTPTLAMTPAAAFYNLAILPGWQKWKPTYRYGTITAIDGDTADVTLDAATSTQQSLGVNQESTLTGVPVEYMSCNGGAFEVGDEVLVKFTGQDWNNPTIIGFKDNPVNCGFYIRFTFNGHNPVSGGEKVRIQFPDDPELNYSQLYRLPLDTEDGLNLIGPFIFSEDKNLGLSLDCEFYFGDNKYTSSSSYFHHYYEQVLADDPERTHSSYVENLVTYHSYYPGGSLTQRVAKFSTVSNAKDTHFWKKVTFIKSQTDLSNATMTTEEINGEMFPVYTIDFEVYGISTAHPLVNGYSYQGLDCGLDDLGANADPFVGAFVINSTFPNELAHNNYSNCNFEESEGFCKVWEAVRSFETQTGLTADNLCIRTDTEGDILPFTTAQIKSELFTKSVQVFHWYYDEIDGTMWDYDICYLDFSPGWRNDGTAIINNWSGLSLLPENYF
jgi:hypothetical protein